MSIRAPSLRSSASHSMRSSKTASWTRDVPVAWVSSTHVGGWRSVASPGYGAVSMSTARRSPARRPVASISIESALHEIGTPTRPKISISAPTWSHAAFSSVSRPPVTAAATRNVPVSIRSETTVWSAPRRRFRPCTSIDVRGRPLHLGTHLAQERDQVVDLGLLGRGPDDRVALCQGRGEHRVLGAHHGDLGERDLAATEPARSLREVVAIAVLDLGAQRPHRVDVQVDRAPADPVAARVADDHAGRTGRGAGRAG